MNSIDALPPIAKEVYRFLVEYAEENAGGAPTLREICEHCDVSSTSFAATNLKRLEDAGLITIASAPGDSKARGIRIVGAKWIGPEIGPELVKALAL